MRVSILVGVAAFSSLLSGAQNRPPIAKAQESPATQISQISSAGQIVAQRGRRPALSLQEGLKIAERYIKVRGIDTSSFYLLEARMILYGSEKGPKEPRWFLWWVHDDGASGNYIEISVGMDGQAMRHPSM